ncbi:MAG: RNA pseudouridine synthase, partial [Polaribacter sp.]
MNPKNTIHFFKDIDGIDLPQKFTFPFQYTPHKLTQIAVDEVQNYLENQTDFNGGFDKLGKMFGVLLVKTSDSKIGYLAGFSGKIDEKVYINGFVPPIFDTLNPNGFYKLGEQKISEINKQIEEFENDNALKVLKDKVSETIENSEKAIADFKQKIKLAKKERDQKRKQQKELLSENEFAIFEQQLKNESIRLNYLLKDLKREWQLKIDKANKELT